MCVNKDALGDKIDFKIPDGGMSVWAAFMNDDIKGISVKAAKKGLVMSDGMPYNMNANYHATRLGFASLNLKEQDKACRNFTEMCALALKVIC